MRSSSILLISIFGLLLSGCMVAQGPGFSEAASPDSTKALVYVYWPKAFVLAARTADIYVDNRKVASLNAGGYAYVYVEPGHHEFWEKWAFNPLFLNLQELVAPKSVGLFADLHPGETHYLRFSTGVGPPAYNAITLEWRIEEVTPSEGKREITTDRHQTLE